MRPPPSTSRPRRVRQRPQSEWHLFPPPPLPRQGSDLRSKQFRHLRPVRPRAASRSARPDVSLRSEEHTSELQSLMRISYAVFCLKKKTTTPTAHQTRNHITTPTHN